MRLTFIGDQTAMFEITIMENTGSHLLMRVVTISKSGSYAWLKRLTSVRATLNAVLLEEIKAPPEGHGCTQAS